MAARKNASIRLPSSLISYNSTVSDHASFPWMMQRPSLSVAREDFNTLSMKLEISIRISDKVLVCWLNSAEWPRDVNSTCILISPSFGLPIFGLIIFSTDWVTTFVCPILTMHCPFSYPNLIRSSLLCAFKSLVSFLVLASMRQSAFIASNMNSRSFLLRD